MPPKCLVCHRADRKDIDEAILAGGTLRDIGRQFGFSKSAVDRHKPHIPTALAQAKAARDGDTVADLLREVREGLRTAIETATEQGDPRAAIGGFKVMLEHVEVALKAQEHQRQAHERELRESRERMLGLLAKELGLDADALMGEYERLEKLL